MYSSGEHPNTDKEISVFHYPNTDNTEHISSLVPTKMKNSKSLIFGQLDINVLMLLFEAPGRIDTTCYKLRVSKENHHKIHVPASKNSEQKFSNHLWLAEFSSVTADVLQI